MDDAVIRLARHLLDHGVSQLSEREKRLIGQIAKRCHVSRDATLAQDEAESFGDHVADKVARFGGSWTFIILFCAILLGWIVTNTVVLARVGGGFDPYPYIFLNLILSMVAALQAPVILMSQNRQASRDRIAASLDYEVNLKAEIEIMALHDKLDRLRVEHLANVLGEQRERIDRLLHLCGDRPGQLLAKPAP